ncbi:hypothetical protein [Polaribacter cellanae]|uniref:Uncharacterized protein n=1 Tax=Polaribacter cellanae TaxID=2818493 RepID=A0A975CJW2_9FLAO|nr:hypothetical protein [Polaribacter cellanae]QTE21023.1 hypothetical protein J3359_09180 [Polaribacter cellanae]
MINILPVDTRQKIDLITEERDLVFPKEEKKFLSEKGSINFLASLSTMKLLFKPSEDLKKAQIRFDVILKSDENILGTIKKYMYYFIQLKKNKKDEDLRSLLLKLKSTDYNLNIKANPSLNNFIQKVFIDDISLIRNFELGYYLMKEITFLIIRPFENQLKLTNSEIIRSIPENKFKEVILDLIHKNCDIDNIAIKKLLYNCNLFLKEHYKKNEMRSLFFCLDIKENFLFFERKLNFIQKIQEKIIENIFIKYDLSNKIDKNNQNDMDNGLSL